ncbi:hypothetical protein [Streptomyces sp. NPDC056683]|uniref:alpha-L-rhamnosidase-related protein n=1 Tax=Streptomyces sp. NPDC056683 TaxID=3345910 RepID=UPI0036784E6C
MGATIIWERWERVLPDGTVNPSGMTSFIYYALGAVADWMHRTVAGLASAEPGYRRLRVERRPGGGPTHARGPAYPARARRRTNRAGPRTAEHPGRDPAARCRAGHGGLGPAPGSSTSTPSSRLSRDVV